MSGYLIPNNPSEYFCKKSSLKNAVQEFKGTILTRSVVLVTRQGQST